MAEENQVESNTGTNQSDVPDNMLANQAAADSAVAATGATEKKRPHRSQKVGAVVSDKMTKTVVVRVDRLVKHTKYRRYVRRTSKFMAHDELGATIGDKVRIVETRPMSARKRWRVIEIVQKAAK
jgi:small subunit ribosomal protein S17